MNGLKRIKAIRVLCTLILLLYFSNPTWAQPSSGVGSGFGIDGGLYSGVLEYPLPEVTQVTDDWFTGSSGEGVIDESQISSIQTLLQYPADSLFIVRMSQPYSSINNNKIWIDALYARDYFGGSGFVDSTSFTSASKNGQNPAVWAGGVANVLGKNDLIDVAGHMRRDGQSLETGDLWFYGLAIIAEPGGASYLDFEFFNEELSYSGTSGFSSGGPDLGHTAFDFSVDWKISKVGDFVFSTDVSSSGMESVDMRIWVSYTDYQYILNNSTPNLNFTFSGTFDGPYTGSPFGYAKIVPQSSNYGQTNSTVADAAPWGHRGTKFNLYSSTDVQEFAIMEMGVNLTEFGIDHTSIEGVDACDFPINTYIVKTRSSASFTAQLKDFAGPYSWGNTVVDAVIIGETVLSCENTSTELQADPIREDATYLWSTTDGNIIGDADTTTIIASQPGTYQLDMWVLLDDVPGGCAAESAQVSVGYDPLKPFIENVTTTSSVDCGGSNGTIDLSFTGGTAPFTYIWSNGATTQDLSGLSPGTYSVTLTDSESCTATTTSVVPVATGISVTPSLSHNDCYGSTEGAISLSVSGSSPFTYAWSTGGVNSNITSLGAGTYTVTITDNEGCTDVSSYSITQPTQITASAVVENATHNNDPGDGTITLTVSGGTPSYTFNWSKFKDGVTTNPYSTSQNLTTLTRGLYTVTITDDNGCTKLLSASVWDVEHCSDLIDNDGDGFIDCEDSECEPLPPGTISTSNANPCVGESVTYSVVNNVSLDGYIWTVPSNVTITSGQGTNSITVTWDTDQAGQICVQANYSNCLSTPTCTTVNPDKTPNAPDEIDVNNN